ncbi:hypothetical protein FPANT_12286 [Fusarium pseudoanthophilum]|uniref:Uncharacterized protein n=1 Tax=Fusarium pseudoanthophilum TaxID=48495 RepID=A0A8H5NPU9_9HYPO|nr:hypothetical protein FPANT_12286 [Fusarium pseudoanthophilum]
MDSSSMEDSQPQPSVEPLDCPTGWPLCARADVEGIEAYNTYVNAWKTWASTDPHEDKDKWGEALDLVDTGKTIFCTFITDGHVVLMNIFDIRVNRYNLTALALQKWYPKSDIEVIGPYNEDGPSFNIALGSGSRMRFELSIALAIFTISIILFTLSARPQDTSLLPLPAILFALRIILQLCLSSPALPCSPSSLPCRSIYVLSSRIADIISEDCMLLLRRQASARSNTHSYISSLMKELPQGHPGDLQ